MKTMKKKYKGRIFINPNIHFGKPCITETRIPIENILELVQEGVPFKEIIEKYYPDLQIEDIKACVQYAVDIIRSEEIHAEVA
jgi:uncharacterized protein (DUF433 family)